MSDKTQYCQTRDLTQDEWFALYQKTKQERDEARAECEEQARLLGMSAEREADLRAKLERIRRGHEGTCYACEVVGELNRKYRATLDKIRAAIEDTTI